MNKLFSSCSFSFIVHVVIKFPHSIEIKTAQRQRFVLGAGTVLKKIVWVRTIRIKR